jgi:hypothetical protein
VTEPLVLLDVDFGEGVFEIVLVNVGDAVAYDVSVRFSTKLRGVASRAPLSELPIFSGLGMLRPGKEIRVLFDTAARVFAGERIVFTAAVTWSDGTGSKSSAEYTHDLDVYRDLPQVVTR